ncbi:hypothetical protein D3C75_1212200 [compost metagenome]
MPWLPGWHHHSIVVDDGNVEALDRPAYCMGAIDAMCSTGRNHQITFCLAVKFVDTYAQRLIAPGQQLVTE